MAKRAEACGGRQARGRARWWIAAVAALTAATGAAGADKEIRACCLDKGACLELPAVICDMLDGIVGEAPSCKGVDCDPFGACCMPDLACAVLSAEACAAAGGMYVGDGMTCDEADCPAVGACCRPDGSCAVETRGACVAAGGVYAGTFTGCVDATCHGACVLADGTCVGRIAPQACALHGGAPLGPGTTCRDVSGPAVAHLASFEILQNDMEILALPRFDDAGGTRRLVRVRIEIDVAVYARVRLVNLGPDPIDTTVPFTETLIADLPLMPLLGLVDATGAIACAEPLPPMEACDYGGPVVFTGAWAHEFGQPDELPFFTGRGAFPMTILGAGQIGPPELSLVSFLVAPHRAEGQVRIVYEYDHVGACCLGGDACQVTTSSQCAALGAEFFGGACAAYPCDRAASPPGP